MGAVARARSLVAWRSFSLWNHERAGRAMISSRWSIRFDALFASISATRNAFSSRSSANTDATSPSMPAMRPAQ